MTNNDNIRLDRIETTLGTHGEKFDAIETTLEIQRHTLEAQGHTLNEQGQRLDRIETVLTNLVTEIKIYDSKLDTYQKASQQVVNIAFGLLATATLAIIVPAVLSR